MGIGVEETAWLVLAGYAISALLLVFVIILWSNVRSMRRKYERMMSGTGVENLPELLADMQQRIGALQSGEEKLAGQLRTLQGKVSAMKGHVALQRYNAFNDHGHGSDLSFSIAMLDEAANGVVLTAIHGRDETYVYGKPIVQGDSKYSLSPEEKKTVDEALKS